MFDLLSEKITGVISSITKNNIIKEKNIEEGIRKIRLAFLDADVNLKVTQAFIKKIKEDSLGEKTIKGISHSDTFIKIIHDNLVDFLGGNKTNKLNLLEPTQITNILMCGLQGSGKTTTSAKLGHFLKKSYSPILVSLDIYRPAANQQLKVMAEKAGVAFFDRNEEKNIKKIIKEANSHAKKKLNNCIIWDTAGRTHVDEALMKEINLIHKEINPVETMLVLDAMIGQQAVKIAQEFKEKVTVSSLFFTKFDSDTRGGAVLSAKSIVNVPVKMVGIGEKITDIDEFSPSRVADRILGMGDIVGLVNKAQDLVDQKEVEKLTNKLKKNQFDLQDFLSQISQIEKMGSLGSLLSMMPGLNKEMLDQVDESKFKKMKYIIQSMTPYERKKSFIINNSRKKRISLGSGTTIVDVNALLKQFKTMKSMFEKMNSKNKMQKMMQKVMGNDTQKMEKLLSKIEEKK